MEVKEMTKETSQTPKKSPTPPYLAITKLEEVINLVSNRMYNEFSASLFKNRGFGNADALLAVNALRFLNLIDDNGKPTEYMSRIGLKGDARKKVFGEIVRAAYKRLFDVVKAPQSPQDLPPDELSNEMKMQYDLSPRVVRQAVPVFLKLAEFAGLIKEGSIVGRKRGPKTNKKEIKKIKHNGTPSRTPKQPDEIVAYDAGFAPVRVAGGRIVLNIPSELKDKILDADETLHDDWSALRAELRKFADKYIPDNLPEDKAPESEKESEDG